MFLRFAWGSTRTRQARWTSLLLGAWALAGTPSATTAEDESASRPGRGDPARYLTEVQPLFETYCFDCHGDRQRAGLDLRRYPAAESVRTHRRLFEAVLQNLEGNLMPPANKPQPPPAARARAVAWLRHELFWVDCTQPDPGRVTLRRLNRTEYNHTLRDLTGVDLRPADDFPMDDIGYGFDNIGDVLSLSPVLFERYLAAAERVLDAAVVTASPLPAELPPSHRRLFFAEPAADTPEAWETCAADLIGTFARRAYRRPVTAEEVAGLMRFYAMARADGESFTASVRVALSAVLVSPHFLFREAAPETDLEAGSVQPVDEFVLASRLSYFLWSTLPDETLFALAERGELRQNLAAQVRRLLADPRADALVDNFAGQWLQFRTLAVVAPDPREFPAFDEPLRAAMRRETELFVQTILREDRSVLEFVDADWTYLNARLARHYGLDGVEGDAFRRVSLAGTARGGVLTQASFLTLTSNPTRTSPVKRGKWVLDNLLGEPPPPPPPGVPELEESPDARLSGTLRERMEQHREDPLCASCHALMDPIGFGFENFDGIGAWRDRDGGHAIDPAGALASGEAFRGPAELKRVLLTAKREEFLRCLATKLLTYALGRGLEYYDRCAVDEVVAALKAGDHRFSALVLGVVNSAPFQLRRAEGTPTAGD
jgi:mono/diheme cytochrome c family protein